MANEFKVRNGVVVNGSGSTILDVQGSQGQLFAINDSLSGSLYSVKNNLGVPVIQAFSDATVKMGAFGAEAIKVTGSLAIVTGSLLGTSSYTINALSASYALNSDYTLSSSFASLTVSASFAQTASAVSTPLFPFTGSAQIIGRLIVTGSVTTTGSLSITGSVGFAYENPNSGVWSIRGAMITARCGLAGAGTQTSALGFGGGTPTAVACTEFFNGSSWTVFSSLITTRVNLGGVGSSTAALAFGGFTVAPLACTNTEAFNGSSWTAGGAMITARQGMGGAGTTTAALAFGGIVGPTTLACTEAYNGAAWSAGTALITGRYSLGCAGTQNAALAFGGSPAVTCTEAYNGSTWSTGGAMIIGRQGVAGVGTQNSALGFGGYPSPVVGRCTEAYNGSTWSVGSPLINARYALGSAGTQTAALAFGGFATPLAVSCTEAFTVSPLQTFNYNPTTGNTFLSSSLNVTGSISVSGSGIINNLTASVAVTASQATNVIPTFSKSITILNNGYLQQSDTGSYPVWRISFPITASQILAFSTSSLSPFSGSLVNISRNVSSSLLTTPLVLTSSTWVSSSVIPFPSFSAGDMLSFNFLTLTGSLTEIVIQVNYTK
jgi:hypothetical protein